MKRETIELGKIKFGKEVLVSDPCYDVGTWCTTNVGIKSGEYNSEIDVVNLGEWGDRIAALRICHKDYPNTQPDTPIFDNVGVDSGQCGFWKPTAYAKIKADEEKNDEFYNRVCNITLAERGAERGGVDKIGVISESGFGDGGYTAYAGYNLDGEIVSLEVEFITDAEAEEYLRYNDDDEIA